MPRLLASCWFLAYLWHFKLSGAPVFLIMPIQILGSRKPNREVRSTLEFSLNLFQVDEEAMCRIKPRESINVAKSREQRWGQWGWRWSGVTGWTDRWDWLISQSKTPSNLSRKMESMHRWITACSQNFKLKQWYIFRLNLLWSFIKHLADKENQQHKPTSKIVIHCTCVYTLLCLHLSYIFLNLCKIINVCGELKLQPYRCLFSWSTN